MSKGQFVPEDQKAFEGSRFYLEHNYRSAAQHYQKALDLEKRDRTLSRNAFRVLVPSRLNFPETNGALASFLPSDALHGAGVSERGA